MPRYGEDELDALLWCYKCRGIHMHRLLGNDKYLCNKCKTIKVTESMAIVLDAEMGRDMRVRKATNRLPTRRESRRTCGNKFNS